MAKRKRNRTVTIRMDDSEYQVFQEKVKTAGLSQQAFIINAIAKSEIKSKAEIEAIKDISRKLADYNMLVRDISLSLEQLLAQKDADDYGLSMDVSLFKGIAGEISGIRLEGERIWQLIRSSLTVKEATVE